MARKKSLDSTSEFIIKREKKKSMPLILKIFTAIIIVICTIVVFVAGAWLYYNKIYKPRYNSEHSDITLLDQAPVSPENDANIGELDIEEKDTYTLNKSKYSFLVIGCDREKWLSDVIMIATYDVSEKSVAIMQIPRDTYVTVSGKLLLDDNNKIMSENFDGVNDYGCKINAVLGQGGRFASTEFSDIISKAKNAGSSKEIIEICNNSFLDISPSDIKDYLEASQSEKREIEYEARLDFAIRYLSALISRSFGIPIDYYAQVNLDGFVNIVDAIGGVDVYVQEDMFYEDPLQDLYIDIKKGQQHLDGKKAEQFIRFRYGYVAADIARIDAQKIFMTAFIKKLISLDGILNLDELIEVVDDNLSTNISFEDAMYFATNALSLDLSKIVMLTMPGSAAWSDNISYYSIDKTSLVEYVNTYLNKYNEPLKEEHFYGVDISERGNESTPPLTAGDITEHQPDLGFIH